jgi:hypothetical protein
METVAGPRQELRSNESRPTESLDEVLARQLELLWSVDLGDTPMALQFEESSRSA